MTTRYREMRRLIYVSRSVTADAAAALDAIVSHASIRNAAVGITGMLWFDGVSFAQVLEGDHDRVGETLARIQADPRHTDLEIVFDREAQGRAFGNWGMIEPDDEPRTIAMTAFLVGLSIAQPGHAAQRLYEIVVACES